MYIPFLKGFAVATCQLCFGTKPTLSSWKKEIILVSVNAMMSPSCWLISPNVGRIFHDVGHVLFLLFEAFCDFIEWKGVIECCMDANKLAGTYQIFIFLQLDLARWQFVHTSLYQLLQSPLFADCPLILIGYIHTMISLSDTHMHDFRSCISMFVFKFPACHQVCLHFR